MEEQEPLAKTIAVRIRRAREARGWTREQLADAAGVSINSLSKWERALSDVGASSLYALSRVLEVSLDYLCGRSNGEEGFAEPFPKGMALVDLDLVEKVCAAKTVRDLEEVIAWEPYVVHFSTIVPANYTLMDAREYHALCVRVNGALDSLKGLEREWLRRFNKRQGGLHRLIRFIE